MNIAGLILAAGESRRMGTAKALLPYGSETFLDTLTALFSTRCSTVIVVLGAQAAEIRSAARRPATFVVNPDYRRGMTTSLQCGLRAVPAEAEGVLFTLVDHPAAAPETLDALLTAPRPLLRVPRYREKRGHPIWFSRDLIAEFLEISPDRPAREVVRGHVDQTEFLDLDDPGITTDIDGPEDYRALVGGAV